jgi:hypothetical protein
MIKTAVTLRLTVVLIPKIRNHLCLISFPYCAGKRTDVFQIECSIKFLSPTYPILATSRGALIVVGSTLESITTLLTRSPRRALTCFYSLRNIHR